MRSKHEPKEFEAQKIENPDELPEIERRTGHKQVQGIADLSFEVIAAHPVIVFEVSNDWFDGRATAEPLPGFAFFVLRFRAST